MLIHIQHGTYIVLQVRLSACHGEIPYGRQALLLRRTPMLLCPSVTLLQALAAHVAAQIKPVISEAGPTHTSRQKAKPPVAGGSSAGADRAEILGKLATIISSIVGDAVAAEQPLMQVLLSTSTKCHSTCSMTCFPAGLTPSIACAAFLYKSADLQVQQLHLIHTLHCASHVP